MAPELRVDLQGPHDLGLVRAPAKAGGIDPLVAA